MLPLPLVPQPTEALLRRLVESQGAVPLSFELFPPRTEARRTALLETVDRLAPVAGEGFSVTIDRRRNQIHSATPRFGSNSD